MHVKDLSGVELNATFSLADEHGGWVLTYESRGPDRNVDYNPGLELLLQRLGVLGASMTDAVLASRDRAKLSHEQRRIEIDGYPYPIALHRLGDVLAFRRALGAAQARIGRDPDAQGRGNGTRRIRLFLAFSNGHRPDAAQLASPLEGASAEVRYWALCANPDRYRVADAIRDFDVDRWTTAGKEIRVGDRVVIWQAQGRSDHRGVVGLGEVIEPARAMSDAENPYWLDREAAVRVEPRVTLKYMAPRGLPLWLGAPGAEFLKDLTVARARGGTVFRMTAAQWSRITRAAGGWREPSSELNALTEQIRGAGRGRSQGRVADATLRGIVEEYAMRRARIHFHARWPEVLDFSRSASFDLLCRDGMREVRVEVKGTTGSGAAVLLTANEVAHARSLHPTSSCSSLAESRSIARRIRRSLTEGKTGSMIPGRCLTPAWWPSHTSTG